MRTWKRTLLAAAGISLLATGVVPAPGVDVPTASADTTVFSNEASFQAATVANTVPLPAGDQSGTSLAFDNVTITAPNGLPTTACGVPSWTLVYDALPYSCASAPTPNPNRAVIVANGDDDYLLTFTNPVTGVGLELVTNSSAQESVTAKDAAGNVLLSTSIDSLTTPNTRTFIGVSSSTKIKTFLLETAGGATQNEAITAIVLGGYTPSLPSRRARGHGWGGFARSPFMHRADPVNTATGAFFDQTTDIGVPAPGEPFAYTRSYNSDDAATGSFGTGWTHSYNVSLTVGADGDIVVRGPGGEQLDYRKRADGSFAPPAGGSPNLTSVSGGYELVGTNLARYRFNTSGRLLSVKDRSNQGVDLAYDGSNRLSTATDAAARAFSFSYNAAGKLATLAAPAGDGRTVSFGYTGNLLTTVTDVRGGVTTYEYAGDRLTKVTDPEGNLQVRNTYDANGRVVEQLDPLGNATTFAWNAATQTSTMTDAKGKTWADMYSGNVLVSSNEPNGTSSVTWDGALNPIGGTDANGKTWSATYDARGNLLTRTAPSPFSYIESWTYDANNNPLTYIDGRANTTSYAYDASGRLTTTTFPGAATETRSYTGAGQLATITDARSNTTTYAYDPSGNLTTLTSAAGNVTTWTYDAAGRPLTRTEPRGNAPGATLAHHTTTWAYDAAGNVLTETDALGRTTTSTYSGTGKVLTRTDALGRITTFAYNDADELVTETAPGGLVTTSAYDSRGQLQSVTSPSGAVTTYAYDDAGRVVSMVEPRGNVAGAMPADYRWSYSYDANGNQTAITDPLGNVTTQAYDALNRLASATDPNGHATTYGYDAASNRTSQANHLGQTTTWAYDARNRVVSTTDPVGKTWSFGYDANSNLIAETTPLGFVTTRTYDADNRLSAVVDPLGNAAGGVPADHDTLYTSDPDGNVVAETDPLGATTTFAYDRVANRVGRTDAKGRTTTWAFDALNRLTSVSAPASGTTTYAYDTAGNLITRTDANTHATTYAYDAEHRLTSLTSPTGERWTYGYDAAGNRTTTVDAKANASGLPALGTTTASYDRAGRLVGVDYSDATPDVTYGYDAAGRRASMVDGAGTETRTYDAADRLTAVARGTDTFGYAYDAAGRITSRAYPDGTTTTLGYDDDGRLTTIGAPEGSTTYGYDPAGRLATTSLPNGVVETRTHDNGHRVASIEATKAGATVSSFDYARDPVGNPTQVVASTGTQSYGYDTADRLTSVCYAASCAAGSLNLTTWTYDHVGNRLTQTVGAATRSYSYNAADQLTQSSLAGVTTAYGYDDNGNQTAAGLDTFAYDMAGRMTTATDATLPATYAYSYDGGGKRVRTTATTPLSTSVTNDAWDTTQPVPEIAVQRDGTGAVTRRFTYGLDRLSTTAGGATSFYHHDGIGSVSRTTSVTAAPQWTFSYEPFGESRSTVKDDVLAPEQPMRFAGEHLDPNGLYHLRARQYDPNTGRFTATDPLAPDIADQYVSSFVYVNDRPTVLVDPTGEKGRAVGAVGGFVGAPPKAPPVPALGPALAGALASSATRSLADEVSGRRRDEQLRQLVLDSAKNQYKDFPRPRYGMIAYRVHNDGKALPARGRFPAVSTSNSAGRWGRSWTPVPPGVFPRTEFYKFAGLPWQNWGVALTKGKLREGVALTGIEMRPALPISDPRYGYSVPGGLIEWVIPHPVQLYVQEVFTVGVNPGYGYATCCGYKL